MDMSYDVIVIGAGAAGLMCAAVAGQRGRRVLLLDHAKKIGEKIRISGGGRCNFTNLHCAPEHFLSANPHFCKSALKQYTQTDFIKMVERHGIAYHEKTLGQLFCDGKSQEIIDMLVNECKAGQVDLRTETAVSKIDYLSENYVVDTDKGRFSAESLVIATGGLSIPKIGATKFGYEVARQFGLNVLPTRPGLVPLTFQAALLERCKAMSGVSVDAVVSYAKTQFREGLLFTHRGISGPSVLQISSYWQEGESVHINKAPDVDALDYLKERKQSQPKQDIITAVSQILPKRLAEETCASVELSGRLADLPDKALAQVSQAINAWAVKPSGTEGYRTAEVTLGGVDTDELSSKTMEAKKQPGLYFVGEVVDVTGHLGGFNFQWAWSSGYAAAQNV